MEANRETAARYSPRLESGGDVLTRIRRELAVGVEKEEDISGSGFRSGIQLIPLAGMSVHDASEAR